MKVKACTTCILIKHMEKWLRSIMTTKLTTHTSTTMTSTMVDKTSFILMTMKPNTEQEITETKNGMGRPWMSTERIKKVGSEKPEDTSINS